MMVYKLFDEEGDYVSTETGEPKNLLFTEIAYTPEGINFGWSEFDSLESAMNYFKIKPKHESF